MWQDTGLRSNHTLRFSMVSLALTLLGALIISGYVSSRLKHDVELLEQHGAAMMTGSLKREDPFSIPSILADVNEVRWTTFAMTGGVLAVVYLSVVGIAWRGAVAVRRQHETLQEAETLRLQNAELRELDRLKSEFVATTSHEFRTPLTGISGFAEVLSESAGLTTQQREWVEFVRTESAHLTEIVNNLLDISSLDRGGAELTLEPVPLNEIIEVVVASFSRASDRHHFAVEGDTSIVVRANREKRFCQIGGHAGVASGSR